MSKAPNDAMGADDVELSHESDDTRLPSCKKVDNYPDYINRSNENIIDANCNIDTTTNFESAVKKTPRRNSNSADKTRNSDRTTNGSIPDVKKFIPLLYDGLPHSIQEKARLELNETDENISKGLVKLRAYIKKENLPPLDEIFLMAFLRVSKYDGKKAKGRLKSYYHMRNKMAEKVDNLNFDTARLVISKNSLGILPYRDEAGRAILFSRGVDWFPEMCDFEEYVMVGFMLIFYLVSIPITTVSGIRYLADLKARSYSQYYLYYRTFKANLQFTNALPARINMNCVHDNALCNWLYTLLHPFIPTKLAKRLRLHGYDYGSLQEEIDVSILPEEYDGTMGPMNNEFMMESFEEFFHKFKAQNAHFLKR